MHAIRSLVGFALVLSLILPLSLGCNSGEGNPSAASIAASASPSGSSVDSESGRTVTEPVQVRAGEASSHTPAQPPQRTRAHEVLLKTSEGDIRLRLDTEKSPLTVDNFLSNYVGRGFYEGTVFHYVEKGFMLAGGGYTSDLQPKETRAFIKNEANNGLQNRRGTIAMVRQPDHADSATSQFFINLTDNPGLNHGKGEGTDKDGYCVFGEVVEGMDVVDRIAEVAVADRGSFPKTPVTPVVIKSAEWIR
jgi:cyclophilin family peptidyl-prolyl cis-trans isomerase